MKGIYFAALCIIVLASVPVASANEGPVKVYILSGQSNMVGIGQVGPTHSSRFNTYKSMGHKPEEGVTLSIYRGKYDASEDYDSLTPIETHHVRLGYWPHKQLPSIHEQSTSIARGYIKVAGPGLYTFKTSDNTILEIAGDEVYRNVDNELVYEKRIQLNPGFHSIKVTFVKGRGESLLAFQKMGTPGTLHTLVAEEGKYPYLMDAEGDWVSRDDVWYKGVVTATANKWLSVGCGARKNNIGPELGFGWELGEFHEEPVLIIKASQGNRSIGWDYLPPGSQRFDAVETTTKTGKEEHMTFAGYRDRREKWPVGKEPEETDSEWYAGKQYDDCFGDAKKVLQNFDRVFPQWQGRGFEIAGFVWWQGHKDQNEVYASRYEHNLVHLIKTLREDFEAPDAPFVLGTIGFGGWELKGHGLTIANAQLAVSEETGNYPEFAGNVRTVETRDFWRDADVSPKSQGFHYNQNAETYLLVGQAFGRAMVGLKEVR